MQVTITAGCIQALCAVLAVLGAFCAWAVQLIIARELRKLNGRYVYADGSKATGREIEHRLHRLEREARRRQRSRGMTGSRRIWMAVAALVACVGAAPAACPTGTTHIVDTLTAADGSAKVGTIYVTGPTGVTSTARSTVAVAIGGAGAVDFCLVGGPAYLYEAEYRWTVNGKATPSYTERWFVPARSVGTVTVAQLWGGSGIPSYLVSPQQIAAAGLNAGEMWIWDGQSWIPGAPLVAGTAQFGDLLYGGVSGWTRLPASAGWLHWDGAVLGYTTPTKSDVGLGSVDNTSDAGKPVSTVQQAALDLKAPLASPTFTGTVGGVTKSMVGLGSVDNTADASKPVSTAQQSALDLKAPLASPTFTGAVVIGSTVLNAAGANMTSTDQVTPTNPTSGRTAVYTKTGTLCALSPAGSETCTGTGGGGTWGSITGTLSAQSDLNTALGLRAPLASPVFTGQATIPDFTLAGHTHQSSGQGGTLDAAAIAAGVLVIARGGTGAATASQNFVFAGPTSGSGAPSYRALVAADVPTLNQNTSGTAAGLSGTPALPNGTTATTQTQADGSAKIATTAYVDTLGATKAASTASTTVNGQSCALGSTCTVTAAPNAAIALGSSGAGGVTGTLPVANGGTGAATTAQNFVFAGPTSGSGAPAFRAVVSADVPTLNQDTTGSAAKINGTPVPANSAADQMIVTTASATGAWKSIPDCVAAGGVLQYSVSTHAPSCHTLVGADLPNPASSVLGGVRSYVAVANQFLTSIGTDGIPVSAQPTEANLSLSDITTNDVSTSRHGLAPKAPNDATKALCGDGTWGKSCGYAAGTALFSTTASATATAASATTVVGTVVGSTTLPANTFTAAGQMGVIDAAGYLTTAGYGGTLTIDLKLGGSVVMTTGAITPPTVTAKTWTVRCPITLRTVGVSATAIGNCLLQIEGATPFSLPLTSTFSLDTTGTIVADVQATWSTTTGSPTITGTNIAFYIPGTPASFAIGEDVNFRAAVAQGASASLGFDLPVSSPAVAVAKNGTNVDYGVAQFASTGLMVKGTFVLPVGWTSISTIDFSFLSESAGGSGNVVWGFYYACVATSGASLDPSWSSVQTVSLAATANNTTNLSTLSPTISGCSAGQKMFFKIALDASTTATGNQDLVDVVFHLRKTVRTF